MRFLMKALAQVKFDDKGLIPEITQTCEKTQHQTIDCGQLSKRYLQRLLREIPGRLLITPIVSVFVCFSIPIGLDRWLVKTPKSYFFRLG
jgi:hypothetical protein